MKKQTCSIMALALSIVCGIGMTSCKKDDGPGANVDKQYEWLDSKYTDSSELTSWDQKTIKLTAWNTLQQGGFKRITASNDVVTPEISRITGVSVDWDNSFDNAGKTADVRYNDLSITGLPDIAFGSSWVDPDAVYDLTDLIDEYCPTIKARMPESVWKASNINGGQKGKVYAIPYGLGNVSLTAVDSKANAEKATMFEYKYDYYPYVMVREDILKDAYPSAHSVEEIQNIYAQNGKITEAELFDVNITSAEQFRTEFLPKIYDTIHKNESKYKISAERWVTPMLSGIGTDRDNWSFMGIFLTQLLGATGTYNNTMFSYWDAVDQKCKILFEQEFYKEELKKWVDMISEGKYLNDYGLLNTNSTIQSELNRGYYAVCYPPNCLPSGDAATLDNGETVKYRRVYLHVPKNERFEYFCTSQPSPSGVCIFKDSVSEKDLPQILRWLDFQCSELCDKLVAWGPETAGLFTETEKGGETVRQFKDETLVQEMVYSTAMLGTTVQKYNLCNATSDQPNRTFTFFYQGGSKDHPKCVYDLSKLSGLINTYYCSANVHASMPKTFIARNANIHEWTDTDLKGVEKLWGRRGTIESALKNVLTSGSSFDSKWKTLLDTANSAGWKESYFEGDFTEAFLNLNEDYLANFYKG